MEGRRRGLDGRVALSEAQPLALKSARELLEVGHGLELLPRISEAYEAGLLSWDQVVALVRFATPETDAELAESARSASVAQLQAAARRARAQSARQEEDNHRRRSLRWRWNHDESWLALSGRLPADQGAVVVTALERLSSQAPPLPSRSMRTSSHAPPTPWSSSPGSASGPTPTPTGPRSWSTSTTMCSTGARVTPSSSTGSGSTPRAPAGSAVTPASRCCCRARTEALWGGTESRTASPRLYRYLKKRDRSCRFPGCHRRLGRAAHHIRWWIHHGVTEPDNLILLCRIHPPPGARGRVEHPGSSRHGADLHPARRQSVPARAPALAPGDQRPLVAGSGRLMPVLPAPRGSDEKPRATNLGG